MVADLSGSTAFWFSVCKTAIGLSSRMSTFAGLHISSKKVKISKKSIYIAHRHETSNALNALVRCKQKRFPRLSETVLANNRIHRPRRKGVASRVAVSTLRLLVSQNPRRLGGNLLTKCGSLLTHSHILLGNMLPLV